MTPLLRGIGNREAGDGCWRRMEARKWPTPTPSQHLIIQSNPQQTKSLKQLLQKNLVILAKSEGPIRIGNRGAGAGC